MLSGKHSEVNNAPGPHREYYQRKIAYYLKHGILSVEPIFPKEQMKVSPEDVERNLANLPQLTFEVTEKCNLRCKYCYYGDYYSMGTDRDYKQAPFCQGTNNTRFFGGQTKIDA